MPDDERLEYRTRERLFCETKWGLFFNIFLDFSPLLPQPTSCLSDESGHGAGVSQR